MLTTRQYLRNLDKETLRKLFELSDLDYYEHWVMTYAFIQKRMRENTCMKLNIGTTKYNTILNQAIIKVEYTIKTLDKIRTL